MDKMSWHDEIGCKLIGLDLHSIRKLRSIHYIINNTVAFIDLFAMQKKMCDLMSYRESLPFLSLKFIQNDMISTLGFVIAFDLS